MSELTPAQIEFLKKERNEISKMSECEKEALRQSAREFFHPANKGPTSTGGKIDH